MERTITATGVVHAGSDELRAVLRDRPGAVLGPPDPNRAPDARRWTTELAVRTRGGSSVGHEVEVELDRVRSDADGFDVALQWRPTAHDAVLPSFTGRLRIEPATPGATRASTVRLEGSYHVPLGPLGAVGDRVVGHRLAEESVAELLADVTARLKREVLGHPRTVHRSERPYGDDLRRRPRSRRC